MDTWREEWQVEADRRWKESCALMMMMWVGLLVFGVAWYCVLTTRRAPACHTLNVTALDDVLRELEHAYLASEAERHVLLKAQGVELLDLGRVVLARMLRVPEFTAPDYWRRDLTPVVDAMGLTARDFVEHVLPPASGRYPRMAFHSSSLPLAVTRTRGVEAWMGTDDPVPLGTIRVMC